jgi:hypothetical protein
MNAQQSRRQKTIRRYLLSAIAEEKTENIKEFPQRLANTKP